MNFSVLAVRNCHQKTHFENFKKLIKKSLESYASENKVNVRAAFDEDTITLAREDAEGRESWKSIPDNYQFAWLLYRLLTVTPEIKTKSDKIVVHYEDFAVYKYKTKYETKEKNVDEKLLVKLNSLITRHYPKSVNFTGTYNPSLNIEIPLVEEEQDDKKDKIKNTIENAINELDSLDIDKEFKLELEKKLQDLYRSNDKDTVLFSFEQPIDKNYKKIPDTELTYKCSTYVNALREVLDKETFSVGNDYVVKCYPKGKGTEGDDYKVKECGSVNTGVLGLGGSRTDMAGSLEALAKKYDIPDYYIRRIVVRRK